MPPRRRPASRHPTSRARLAAILLSLATVVNACADDAAVVVPVPAPNVAPDAGVTGGLVIVLPPADGLADAERERIRLLVARALETALPTGGAAPVLLEPADAGSLVDAVERAVRRAGTGGTVCVLGAGVLDVVAPVVALYPATRLCLLPVSGPDRDGLLAADVDLEQVGRELGAAARAAAGDGSVLVLAGGDAMLDRRWRTGLEATANGPSGALAGRSALHTVGTAAELLALLDEQAVLIEQGIVPGSREALGGDADGGLLDPPLDARIPSRALPPVAVVVLDASREAQLLVGPLAERGVRVIAPRSLLLAAGAPEDGVVLRWRIRWDVPLAELVRRGTSGEGPPPAGGDALVLEPGPAHVTP